MNTLGPNNLTKRVEILQSPCKKLFKNCVGTWYPPAEIDEGIWDDGFWNDDEVSGLFANVDDCEREARLSVPFLRSVPLDADCDLKAL